MIALMRPRKGVEVALEAMQQVKSQYGNAGRFRVVAVYLRLRHAV